MCRMACVGWKLGLLVLAAALSVVVGPSEARRLLGPAPYLQCGGSGGDCNSPGGVCQDVAWPDFRCPGDFVCGRINVFYWQCDKPKTVTKTGPPTGPKASIAPRAYTPSDFKQCGGVTNCKGSQCRDGVWPGTKCAAGLTCYKTSQFYYACDVKPPKKTEAPVAVTPVANSGNAWKQCGGLDANTCVGAGKAKCKDAPWAGFLCPAGFQCYRSNAWHWGCRPGPVTDGSG